MIKDIDKFNELIKKAENIIKQLKELNVEEEQLDGQISLDIPEVVKPSKTQLINDNFENVWKLIPSTQWDSKKRVTKETKTRLYDYTFEQIKSACDLYLNTQKVEYRFKRDKFFNEIIWNYLDMVEESRTPQHSNFSFIGF